MKSKIKLLIIIILIFVTGGCRSLIFKPHFSTGAYTRAYAIIENGKINRMGVPKKDTDKMERIIYEKYGIRFTNDEQIYAPKDVDTRYKIRFYNDLKIIINGREYIISKEKIRQSAYNTCFIKPPVSIINTDDNEYILDIGEIEIIDLDGKVLKPRRKIPPILFKKTILRTFVNDINGNDIDYYYRGWAEYYPKDPSTLKILPKRSKYIIKD